MHGIRLALLLLVVLVLPTSGNGQNLTKLKVAYTSRSIAFLTAFVAKEFGLYQKQGLDVDLVQILPQLAVTALASKEVDYSYNIGSTMRAAMKGMPVRAVALSLKAPFFALVSREDSVMNLKGKVVGSTNPGGTNYQVTKLILAHYGLQPTWDYELLSLGVDEKSLFDALVAGKIAAGAISPPWPFLAEKSGFKILVRASDVVSLPFVGVCAGVEKIKSARNEVKQMILAEINALSAIRQQRTSVIQLMSRRFSMDTAIAEKSYDFTIPFFSDDGVIDPEGVKQLINIEREAGMVQKEIATAAIADITLVREVHKERVLKR